MIHLRRKDAATTTDVLAFSVNDSIARVDWVVHIGATLGGSATPTTPVTYTIPEVITTAPNDVCVDATSAVTSAAIALPRASNATIVPPVFGLSGIRPNSLPSTTCTTPTSVLSLTPTVRSTAMLRAKTMPSFWAPLNVIKGALGHGEDATHVTPLSDSSAVMLKCVHRMVHAFKLRKEQRAAIEIQRVYRGYRYDMLRAGPFSLT